MNKALSIRQYIIDNDIDVLYITETWFKNKGDQMYNLKDISLTIILEMIQIGRWNSSSL